MAKHPGTKKRSSEDIRPISEPPASMGRDEGRGTSYIREMIPNRDGDSDVFYNSVLGKEDSVVHLENIGKIVRKRSVSAITDGGLPQFMVDGLGLQIKKPLEESISYMNRNKVGKKVFLSISNDFQNNVIPDSPNDPKIRAKRNNAFGDETEQQFLSFSNSKYTLKHQDTGSTHPGPPDTTATEFMVYTAQHHLDVDSSRYTSDPMECQSPHVPELACPIIAGTGSARASAELLPRHAAAMGVALMVAAVMLLAAAVLGCR